MLPEQQGQALALNPVVRALIQSSSEELPEEQDDSLDEAARTEREYVRRRLREDLGREPSEEEVDEWLRRHTEGY